MEWLSSLFLEHSALQAVVVLSLISAIGLGLGRVHFWGVSLGVTFVFFAGILAGHFGLSVDPQMLNYAERAKETGTDLQTERINENDQSETFCVV